MRVVVCTAISGVEARAFLSQVRQMRPEKIAVFDVGREMVDLAISRGQTIDAERILNRYTSTLFALRSAALEKLVRRKEQLEREGYQLLLVDMHAIFPWRNSFIPGLDSRYLTQIQPDAYVTLVDDIVAIENRLRRRWNWQWLSLEQMLVWQDLEVSFTEMMAGFRTMDDSHESLGRISSLIYPIRQKPETFLRLVTEPTVKKIYVSYPITHISDQEIEAAHRLIDDLDDSFVVFDPMAVEDMDVVAPLEALLQEQPVVPQPPPAMPGFEPSYQGEVEAARTRISGLLEERDWSARCPGVLRALDRIRAPKRRAEVAHFIANVIERMIDGSHTERDVERILEHIKDQTVARDYALISQSDGLLVRYPPTKLDLRIVDTRGFSTEAPQEYKIIDAETGAAPTTELIGLSVGVLSEMIYGFTHDKDVFVIWLAEARPSPFLTHHTSELFHSEGDAKKFLLHRWK